MNRMLMIAGRLAAICATAAVVLSVVSSLTEPVIQERKARELQEALSSLIESGEIGEPEAVSDDPVVKTRYAVTDNGEISAWILDLNGSGYGGDMKIVASYKADGELLSAVLMNNAETPGLGKKAEDPAYMEKYTGTGAETPVPSRKDQLPAAEAEAVTGATITFAGVGKALQAGSVYVKEVSHE